MADEASVTAARRYLLGQMGEAEASEIERDYVCDERCGNLLAVAEEHLIEDYLADRLSADERSRFERHYLAAPSHRLRVDVIRLLRNRAGRDDPEDGA